MKTTLSVTRMVAAAVAVALCLSANLAIAQQSAKSGAHPAFDMTVVRPETVGFSSEGLERLHQFMQ
jgi:hypothetical protein